MGRWSSKDTVEQHKALDVRYLRKHNLLTPGYHSISWSWGGQPSGNITYIVEDGGLILIYRYRGRGSEWEDVRQRVTITWTPCNYGGQRPWLICGNCGRRVAVLYGAGKYFACRRCYDLTYRSCQESDSRFSRLSRYGNPGLTSWKDMPTWAVKGLLDQAWKEEQRSEKEMSRRLPGRPRKVAHNRRR